MINFFQVTSKAGQKVLVSTNQILYVRPSTIKDNLMVIQFAGEQALVVQETYEEIVDFIHTSQTED